MEYKIKKSKRKTLCLEITPEGLLVRAPIRATKREIDDFIEKKQGWILKHIDTFEKNKDVKKFTADELKALAASALDYIPKRVEYYAGIIGVRFSRITIRNQRTKWGSCSAKGNLNFNCLLMLTPPEVIDSVVVHELCHIRHLNHSKEFYQLVLKTYPDYYKWNNWLKENGRAIMARMVQNEDLY